MIRYQSPRPDPRDYLARELAETYDPATARRVLEWHDAGHDLWPCPWLSTLEREGLQAVVDSARPMESAGRGRRS